MNATPSKLKSKKKRKPSASITKQSNASKKKRGVLVSSMDASTASDLSSKSTNKKSDKNETISLESHPNSPAPTPTKLPPESTNEMNDENDKPISASSTYASASTPTKLPPK